VTDALTELRGRIHEVYLLRSASAVLEWDRATQMPERGAEGRARQLALLGRTSHARLTDDRVGALLDELAPLEAQGGDDDDAAFIRVTRREYELARRVPEAFVAERSAHTSASYLAWTRAKPANDFRAMVPYLQKTLELSRRYAEYFPDRAHWADPHIAESDYGATAASVRELFARLRAELVPLVQAVLDEEPPDDSFLRASYPRAAQLAFASEVVEALGYDFRCGRLDLAPHPFETRLSAGDVRITTRVVENDLTSALFIAMHEAGHALYDLALDPRLDDTPLGAGASAGVHESQSRLWENLVGRSLEFWTHFYPRLQRVFPDPLAQIPLDAFYRAINKVQRTPHRGGADELTYNLHVMIRVDLEAQLLDGTLAVEDLPEAWNARYEADLGLRPRDDAEGVLQDVHWYDTMIGGQFQSYTLGNILSAQLYEAAARELPDLPQRIARGELGALRDWLGQSVHRHGAKYTAEQLVFRATGAPLSPEPYLRYLRGKFGALYGLP
jgi:carboxypeptidase Taq